MVFLISQKGLRGPAALHHNNPRANAKKRKKESDTANMESMTQNRNETSLRQDLMAVIQKPYPLYWSPGSIISFK